jgi:hypothetical protein
MQGVNKSVAIGRARHPPIAIELNTGSSLLRPGRCQFASSRDKITASAAISVKSCMMQRRWTAMAQDNRAPVSFGTKTRKAALP